MSARRSNNPITRFLQVHDWQWFSTDEIIEATGCTQKEIMFLYYRQNGDHYIEYKDDKYRYIGSRMNPRRALVETLKKAYPDALDVSTLTKKSNQSIFVAQIITRYSDLLPIEIIGAGPKRQFRYILNDDRSLIEMDVEARKGYTKKIIYSILTTNEGRRFTSAEISEKIKGKPIQTVGKYLSQMAKEFPDIHSKRRHHCHSVYWYQQGEVFA